MFHGSIVAIVTPMRGSGLATELDLDSMTKLIEFHIEQGTDAIVVAGTTGEAATLTSAEKTTLIRHTIKHVRGRIPVIAGTAANSTQAAIERTRAAMELGVDACLLMTPAYIKPTQEGLFQHYKATAEQVAIPQIIYNVPSRTACDILPQTVARLAKSPNIVGIKEATGSVERAREIMQLCDGTLDVYSGEDNTALDLMLHGAKGTISVTANVAPKLMHEMCQAAISGDVEKAKACNASLQNLHETLFVETNPIPVKWAVAELGLCQQTMRLPMTILAEQHRDSVRSVMRNAGIPQ